MSAVPVAALKSSVILLPVFAPAVSLTVVLVLITAFSMEPPAETVSMPPEETIGFAAEPPS